MTKKSLSTKNGDEWTWEETPETVEALKKLHDSVVKANAKHAGNYPGPLYAPHPHIRNDENKN
jgi:hypothetical protein